MSLQAGALVPGDLRLAGIVIRICRAGCPASSFQAATARITAATATSLRDAPLAAARCLIEVVSSAVKATAANGSDGPAPGGAEDRDRKGGSAGPRASIAGRKPANRAVSPPRSLAVDPLSVGACSGGGVEGWTAEGAATAAGEPDRRLTSRAGVRNGAGSLP